MYVANDWDKLFQGGVGTTHKVVPVATGTDAVILEVHGRPKDQYGEAMQGDEECYIIFQVGDRFFKKTGYEDSYDEERTWNGPVVEVFGTTKTVTVFVPAGRR